LKLVGGVSKNQMNPCPLSKIGTDSLVEKWILATKRNRELYTRYRQSDPDLYALWKDFSKYDKPDPLFDDQAFAKAYGFMSRAFGFHCKGSGIWDHEQVLGSWNMATSPGYPWNRSVHTTKEFVEVMGMHLPSIWEYFLNGGDICPIWNVSPKFELRKDAKLRERKIRSFTAAPKHFSYCVQKLCSDFNQKFYNSHSQTWSRVGMSMFGGDWDVMIRQLSRFKNGMEFDATQWDSSLAQRVLRAVCAFRKSMLDPRLGSEYHVALDRVYDEIIQGLCVLPGGHVFMKNAGNPSGSPNTVVDNTLGLYLVFAYITILAFKEKGVDISFEDFNKNVVAAMYGDDNTVTISDEWIGTLSAETILRISTAIGVAFRNEYPELRRVEDLKFLNMKTRKVNGVWMPFPDTDKMRGSMLNNDGSAVYRYVRLCGLRTVAFFSEVLPELEELIELAGKEMLQLDQDLVDASVGLSPRQAQSVYLTHAQLLALWFGFESKAVAGVKTDRFKNQSWFLGVLDQKTL